MILTILTEYALKVAIQVGLELKKIYTSEVDDGITKAFRLALSDWSKHTPSSSEELRLTKALESYIQSSTSYGVLDADTQESIDCFKKRLSEQPAAHNYLMTLRADEQARSEEQNILEHRKTQELLQRIMSQLEGVGIKPEELRALLRELPLKEGQVATDLSLEEMLHTKRILSEEVKQLLAEFVQFFFEYTDNLTEEIQRLRATGDNYLAETLEDIKRVLAGESKRSLTAIHEEFKEREQQKEIKVLKELIEAAQLQFSFKEACGFYERLLELAPTAEYHFNYALLLQNLNEFDQARSHYEEALKAIQVSGQESDRGKVGIANILNNLGKLFCDIGEFKKAQTHYEEALKIRLELADKNPQVYKPYVATTQQNLAILYRDLGMKEKAEEAYQEARSIRQDLANLNPTAYEIDYAKILVTGIVSLGKPTGELEEAKAILLKYSEHPKAKRLLEIIDKRLKEQ